MSSKRRTDLARYDGKRMRFNGKVAAFSRKSKHQQSPRTVLLKDIKLINSNEVLAKHLWLMDGEWSRSLRPGDQISFDARVRLYEKNYKGKKNSRFNYKLFNPNNVRY